MCLCEPRCLFLLTQRLTLSVAEPWALLVCLLWPVQAVSSFDSVIDQMTVGHLWLQDTLNATSDIGWQVCLSRLCCPRL